MFVDKLETTGQFWSPDDATKRINGALTWEPGSRARLILESRVIDELANPVTFTKTGFSIAHSGDPARIVVDGVPRLLLGETEIGPVTCLDSYLQHLPTNLFDRTTPPFQQVWDPIFLIVGAHLVEGHATELDGVRAVVDGPGWWSHLPDGGVATSDAGEVECERLDDETWLEFRPSSALSIHAADRSVRSVLTLAKLALDADLTPGRMKIRIAGQSAWLDVQTGSENPGKISWPDPHNLLPPESLTLERIARWLEIERTMDGLAAAVANPVKGEAMQVHGLVACSLIEGIHKRIANPGKRDYIDRVRDLHATAQRVAPEITDPVDKWDALVRNARNDLAHHNTGRSFEAQYLNWMIAESSVNWVLRLCLLAHAGFPDEDVRSALADHQRYDFYRENLKMHVEELGTK